MFAEETSPMSLISRDLHASLASAVLIFVRLSIVRKPFEMKSNNERLSVRELYKRLTLEESGKFESHRTLPSNMSLNAITLASMGYRGNRLDLYERH